MWFIPLLMAAGSALGSYTNAQNQASAINKQQNSAFDESQKWDALYQDMVGKGSTASDNANTDAWTRFGGGQRILKIMGEQGGGVFNVLQSLKTTSSSLADQSGTIGKGGNELYDPTIVKAKNKLATDMATAGLNMFGNFLTTQNSLAQSNLARLGNMAQGAMGNAGSAGQNMIAAKGNYASSNLGTGMAAVGAGMSIIDYLRRNSQNDVQGTGGVSNA